MIDNLGWTWLKGFKTDIWQRKLLGYYCRKVEEGGRLECFVKRAQHAWIQPDKKAFHCLQCKMPYSNMPNFGSKKQLKISFFIYKMYCPKIAYFQ